MSIDCDGVNTNQTGHVINGLRTNPIDSLDRIAKLLDRQVSLQILDVVDSPLVQESNQCFEAGHLFMMSPIKKLPRPPLLDQLQQGRNRIKLGIGS